MTTFLHFALLFLLLATAVFQAASAYKHWRCSESTEITRLRYEYRSLMWADIASVAALIALIAVLL